MSIYNFYGNKNRKKYFDEGSELTHEEAENFAVRMSAVWKSDVTFYAKDNPDKFYFYYLDRQECLCCGSVVTVISGVIDKNEDFFCCEECADLYDKRKFCESCGAKPDVLNVVELKDCNITVCDDCLEHDDKIINVINQ